MVTTRLVLANPNTNFNPKPTMEAFMYLYWSLPDRFFDSLSAIDDLINWLYTLLIGTLYTAKECLMCIPENQWPTTEYSATQSEGFKTRRNKLSVAVETER